MKHAAIHRIRSFALFALFYHLSKCIEMALCVLIERSEQINFRIKASAAVKDPAVTSAYGKYIDWQA